MTRKAGCQVGGGDNGRGRVEIPGRGSGRGRARLGFVGTRPSLRFENGKRGRAGESEEPEEPEEPGLRSERIQSSLPPRYLGEINGKNREPAGEGRGGRTECEKVRTDAEGRGPGEKGSRGNRQGRRRLFARGPRSSRLPSRLRSAPPLSPAPTAPEAGQGKYPPGDFWYPSKCATYAFPEPWRPPASSPYNLAGLPVRYAPEHGRDKDLHHASAVPPSRDRALRRP